MKFEEGQEVLRCSGGALKVYSLEVVSKITPKGFVRVGNELYKNSEKGISYAKGGSCWAIPSITNDKDKIEKFKKEKFVKHIKTKIQSIEFSYEQAVKINEILKGE